jgi:hypothetical protein
MLRIPAAAKPLACGLALSLAAAACQSAKSIAWLRGGGAGEPPAPDPSRPPTDNPIRSFYGAGEKCPPWTDEIRWSNAVSFADFPGEPDERFVRAQSALLVRGGGVIYFPPGVYRFSNSLELANGCVIRGATPPLAASAKRDDYAPPTRLEFPKYLPSFEGMGTPNATAFKAIRLAGPATASNCGVVNVAINRAHVALGEVHDPADNRHHECGRNRLVFGCRLTNTASVDERIPYVRFGQHPWQRFTARHTAAIHVHAAENALVANNRIPKSGDDSFLMKGYVVFRPTNNMDTKAFNPDAHGVGAKIVVDEGVPFDFDNRPGIYVNEYGDLGAQGDGVPNATPETAPHAFRKGLVIRDNYVFATGRTALSFSGDGTLCADNVVRIPPDVWRPTCKGYEVSDPRSTNDNRAIRCRGYRWTVSGNDYQVFANLAFDRRQSICDGEGIMHENHTNSKVLDSRVTGNRGNAYICIWRVEVDGLDVRGNDIALPPSQCAAITVLGKKKNFKGDCPVRRLAVVDNVTRGAGDAKADAIRVEGLPTDKVTIEGNRHFGAAAGLLWNGTCADATRNKHYEIRTP